MKHIAFAMVAALALPAAARDLISVAPVYSQLVAWAAPEGFHAGYEAEQDGSYILEMVPAGDTVEHWGQMITLTGAKGAAGVEPIEFAARLAEGFQAACPGTFAARSFPAPRIRGAAQAFAGYLGCGTVEGRSEAMVFIVARGREDLYTLQWAERGAPLDRAPEPDAAKWKPRADALALTRICDRQDGEAAPYPSCTE